MPVGRGASAAEASGPYITWFQEKYRRNLRRIGANFALFDCLLYRAYHDASVAEHDLYRLGFTGFFDSPLYFVGYKMAQLVERHLGRERLLALYQAEAPAFFRAYVDICKTTGDPEAVAFAEATLQILDAL